MSFSISRREFCAGLIAAAASNSFLHAADENSFHLNYIVGTSLFGQTHLREIMPEIRKTGATAIDLWPKIHGAQREQLDEMGEAAFAELLKQNDVRLGCMTQYKLGPFALLDEMQVAHRLGCSLIVSGAEGKKNLTGQALEIAIATFVENLKPHLDSADQVGVTIAIENHSGLLISSPDAIKLLLELCPNPRLGIALAPYHLPQDPKLIADLIQTIGNRISIFYAWQFGMGCMTKLPKEQELLQLPGRGDLDFGPLLAALKQIQYQGWTEIFMHPTPRGIPILEPTRAVIDEINRSRRYLEERLSTPKP